MYNGYKKELGLQENVRLAYQNERTIRTSILRSLFPQLNYYSTATDVAKVCNVPKKIVTQLGYGYYGRSIKDAPNRTDLIRIIQALRNHKSPTEIGMPLPELLEVTEANVDMIYTAHFDALESSYASDLTGKIFIGNGFLTKMRKDFLGVENLDTRVTSFLDYLYYHQPVFTEFIDLYGEQAVLDEFLKQRMDAYIKRFFLT